MADQDSQNNPMLPNFKRNDLTVGVSALDFLNRPGMKKAAEEEKEKKETEERAKQPPFFVRNAKWVMLIFANLVAITFDALAVWAVYTITGNVLFAFLAILPTGIPMIIWEVGWMYPLASPFQKKISIQGIVLSIISAIVVGIGSAGVEIGAVWEIRELQIISFALMILWVVGAVIRHAVQAGKYFYKDPITEQEHSLQVVLSENEFQVRALNHSRTIMTTAEEAILQEKAMRDKYGDALVDRALGIVLQVDVSKKSDTANP